MFKTIPLKKIILLWAVWVVVLLGFQKCVATRFQPERPDDVLFWTANETGAEHKKEFPLLGDPFMNEHVAYDSEHYISIALFGYDSPFARTVEHDKKKYSLSYAFFPLYPALMYVVSQPLKIFNLTPVATLTLAGVIISLLGTLVAMIALYDLARIHLDEAGALKAVFFFLVFPSAFFLGQVYTEGLFAGLAFACLALMQRGGRDIRYFFAAGVCAALAVLTRAVGGALAIAFIFRCLMNEPEGYGFTFCPFPRKAFLKGTLFALFPIGAYVVWSFSPLGVNFSIVERFFFGRGTFQFMRTFYQFSLAIGNIFGGENFLSGGSPYKTGIYFMIEISAVIAGLVSCLSIRKKWPDLAAFGLFAWAIAVFSGGFQSMVRYMLVIPCIYLFVAGKKDKSLFAMVWTMVSVLLFGLLATLYTFDFWVA
ncbi:MAG: hypothetical protein JW969_18075 [Spirochaetales bacterium]|nr:hypothetical protein [Spirochaetales bacterium]